MQNQKHLFNLPENIHYLNGAYMSPQLKTVTEAGQKALIAKERPFETSIDDFFDPVDQLKATFARLIGVDNKYQIALIPSVSYGIANVTNNIELWETDEILLVDEQFPSNYYAWKKLADQYQSTIEIVRPPDSANRANAWNEAILNNIHEGTKVVAISHVHWADGTVFDLKAIRKRTREVGALLIIDGTQSVGAMPLNVKEYEIDALICGGYKWLLGPYSLGLAYYDPVFNNGEPIEENWINRAQSNDFKSLVNYQASYRPFANRFSVGEHSNFILVPMLNAALNQLLEWGVPNIQSYCKSIAVDAVEELRNIGCMIEKEEQRCGHLFGVRLAKKMDVERLKMIFQKENVHVSFRGNAIRVSPNVYNIKKDFDVFLNCFRQL